MRTRKKIRRKRISIKQTFPIEVVYKSGKKMYRGKLSKNKVKIKKDGKIILPKNYYSKGFLQRLSNIDWNKLPKMPKLLNKKKSRKKCKIKNQHGETIMLPLEYPGNEVVHQNLNPERHKDILLFDKEYFKKLYADYKKIC